MKTKDCKHATREECLKCKKCKGKFVVKKTTENYIELEVKK